MSLIFNFSQFENQAQTNHINIHFKPPQRDKI